MASLSETASETAQRFQAHMQRNGLKPSDLFLEYDREKSGFLRPDQFARALTSARFYFTPREMKALESEYGDTGSICYRRLCEDISPRGSLSMSRSPTFKTVNHNDLARFGQSLKARNVNICDIMRDYDRHHLGHVNVRVFRQAVGESTRVVESIVQPYMTGDEVDYLAMQEDLDRLDEMTGMTVTTMVCPLPPFFSEFAREVNDKRVNLKDLLMETKPVERSVILPKSMSGSQRLVMSPIRPSSGTARLKRTEIPLAQCLAVLGSLKLAFSPQQLEEVCAPFTAPEGVDVNALCQAVQSEINMVTQDTSKWTTKKKTPTDLDVVIDEVRENITKRRLHISDLIEDELRRLKGVMTKGDFYRFLNYQGIVFSECDVMALDHAFMLPTGTMDARGFADAVDPPVIKTEYHVDETVQKLSDFVHKNNINLVPLFGAYDRAQCGRVTIAQFTALMKRIGFTVTDFEVRHLANNYGDAQSINWRQVCTDTDQVFPEPPKPKERPTAAFCTSGPSGAIEELMREINACAKKTKTDLFGEFMIFDSFKKGVVPRRRFKDVIEALPLKCDTGKIEELTQYYCDPALDAVDYRQFSRDLENYPEPPPRETLALSRISRGDGYLDDEESRRLAMSTWTVPPGAMPTLRRLRAAANCRRIDLEQLFYAVDHSRTGYVDCDVVEAILQPLDRFLTDQHYREILDVFRDKRMPEKFNYKRLCAAFYNVQPTREEINEVTALASEVKEVSVAMVLSNEIRSRLESRHTYIRAFFRNITTDTLSESEFLRILNSLPILLKDREKTMVLRQDTHDGLVDWRSFVKDVEESKPYLSPIQ